MIDWPIASLIPHAGDMILIDEVLDFDDEHIRTRLRIKANGLLNAPDGSLPGWVGVELMAQSVAAFAGCQARARGEPVELGFLLGTRQYHCNVPSFAVGSELTIHATQTLQDDNGMGVFECHLEGPSIHAEARLTVFRPQEVARYLEEPCV
ncbi:ApeP family dehydratase [Pseudomonas panipatensis]|uniref:ApeP family dehydratase n=1 Tax=Pseudomonas panipatensis TaxID=428992 RepID=UPI0035B3B152